MVLEVVKKTWALLVREYRWNDFGACLGLIGSENHAEVVGGSCFSYDEHGIGGDLPEIQPWRLANVVV